MVYVLSMSKFTFTKKYFLLEYYVRNNGQWAVKLLENNAHPR